MHKNYIDLKRFLFNIKEEEGISEDNTVDSLPVVTYRHDVSEFICLIGFCLIYSSVDSIILYH